MSLNRGFLIRSLPALFLGAAIIFSNTARAMTLKTIDDGEVYYATLTGVMEPGTDTLIKARLNLITRKKPVAIFINSEGGAYDEVKPMVDLLLDLAKKHYDLHRRPLLLTFQNVCASDCSILSAELTQRRDPKTMAIRVASDTQFGFHGSVIHVDGKVDRATTIAAKNRLEKQIYQTYLNAGVSPTFLNTNKDMFKVHFRQKTFTAAEMCAQKTMVIPPDACVENQMEVYKWIVRATSDRRQQEILIPPEKRQ